MKEHQTITSAQQGTLIHLCLQYLNEKEVYSKDKVEELIKRLVEEQKITKEEAKVINIQQIYEFTKSKIWSEITTAKEVYKEQPFYYFIPAKEIYNEEVEENILVQGIIDLYYIDTNGNITLVDYKTDHVKNEQEIIEKYKNQLEIYKKALEESCGKKVKNVYIYSTYLNKEINIHSMK